MPAPGLDVAPGQVDAVDDHAPGARLGETQQEVGDRALSGPARADERDRLSGGQLEVEALEHEPRARRVAEGHPFEPDRSAGRARRLERTPGVDRGGGIEKPEDAIGDGEPVGARVILRAQLPKRQVELRGEDEDGQPRLQPDSPVDEPDSDGDRDQRHPERRGQLEHGARQEADA